MPCTNQADKYKFCTNTNYYEGLLQYIKVKKDDVTNEGNCDDIILDVNFNENVTAKDICQEFMIIYKYFSVFRGEKTPESDPFSLYDCDFLNYWLNCKLRESANDGSINVKKFYEKIKEKNNNFFSKTNNLDEYLYDIDLIVLENMKLLYNLYDKAIKIISIINTQYYTDRERNEAQKSCSEYTKKCDENYKKAMDMCFNINDDFYNALKNFKDGYKIITEPSSNESNVCNSSEFYYFPEYDGVLEKKKNAIKISSTFLVLSFALPLIYKYTPFGPFLRANINRVKNKWMNSDEYGSELSSLPIDFEDNISDNEEYNIGYSETN
ncbi:PIR protein [Plasmodium ovale]|uniref:PIR protein n=2 Tax=Plasmodium ovale TaxID=36330 RepID=A0A1D3JD89_PLAOA|nr:PIR Superfamily Protein [Plasmodium ovale curtisi]SBT83520.1 PIR protein [Plasmodium ovale]SBT83712.1 PIR protein [Plasmodium ovale]